MKVTKEYLRELSKLKKDLKTKKTMRFPSNIFFSKKRTILIIYSVIVLAASYFTYFKDYDYPPSVFWDENYHIASGPKISDGVMFMETHPPLGENYLLL